MNTRGNLSHIRKCFDILLRSCGVFVVLENCPVEVVVCDVRRTVATVTALDTPNGGVSMWRLRTSTRER